MSVLGDGGQPACSQCRIHKSQCVYLPRAPRMPRQKPRKEGSTISKRGSSGQMQSRESFSRATWLNDSTIPEQILGSNDIPTQVIVGSCSDGNSNVASEYSNSTDMAAIADFEEAEVVVSSLGGDSDIDQMMVTSHLNQNTLATGGINGDIRIADIFNLEHNHVDMMNMDAVTLPNDVTFSNLTGDDNVHEDAFVDPNIDPNLMADVSGDHDSPHTSAMLEVSFDDEDYGHSLQFASSSHIKYMGKQYSVTLGVFFANMGIYRALHIRKTC